MIDIKTIRLKTGLSQQEFGERYNIPVASIRDWEQGRRKCPEYVTELLDFRVEFDIKEGEEP